MLQQANFAILFKRMHTLGSENEQKKILLKISQIMAILPVLQF